SPDDRALDFTDNQPSDSMKTGEQLMAEAKARIKEVTPQEALDRQRRGDSVTFLDVRDLHEVNAAKIPGTIHVSRGNLETKIEAQLPRGPHVVVSCAHSKLYICFA